MNYEEVLARFKAVKNGDNFAAHCPAHEDKKASLSLSLRDDKILVKCHAGCETEAVLSAAGLAMKDLFINGNGHARSPVVATYLYRDLDGEVRYRKQRTADKQFYFARRGNGPDDWIASRKQNGDRPVMEGVERLVYRLDELRERSENSSSETFCVFVCEGEKDADRLWSLGLPATTNDAGAGKWTDALTGQLKAIGTTSVRCLPDNDDPGRAHMQDVARSCTAAGIEARIIELPGLPPKGDVSDYLAAGHAKDDLLILCTAASVCAPLLVAEVTGPAPCVYTFEPAFPDGHFVTSWIDHFSRQCDAAREFHEAAALVALAQATPTLTARTSGAAQGLRTNLYVLLVGDPGRSRKSTAKDYAVEAVNLALPGVMLPESMSHEGMIEALAERSASGLTEGTGAALWAVDEFSDMLVKLVTARHLAGMRGLLLELYARTTYTYKRVSKGKSHAEDAFRIQNVSFSVIGCSTPTVFQNLDNTAVGSGLLSRFAIVMPEAKPARLPLYALQEDAVPAGLVQRLRSISERTAHRTVEFAPGVLEQLDAAVDAPLDQATDRGLMTERLGVMARKVAILAAAGWPDSTPVIASQPLIVGSADAEAAIAVAARWIAYARAFEVRVNESVFEVQVQRCLALITGRTGWINRREIARRVHLEARQMREVEQTLVQRDQLEVSEKRPTTGRPAVFWRWIV